MRTLKLPYNLFLEIPMKAIPRCDVCGRFIPLKDLDSGAVRRLLTPDSAFTTETFETLCKEHNSAN